MVTKNSERFILLIRHSSVLFDKRKPTNKWYLSAEGRQRCQQFAPLVTPFKPDLFITSKENKAIETGMLLAKELGVPVQCGRNLHEQERQGAPFYPDPQNFRDKIARLFATPNQLVFGQETAAQADERFNAAVSEMN